jgi:hypothetical protein
MGNLPPTALSVPAVNRIFLEARAARVHTGNHPLTPGADTTVFLFPRPFRRQKKKQTLEYRHPSGSHNHIQSLMERTDMSAWPNHEHNTKV